LQKSGLFSAEKIGAFSAENGKKTITRNTFSAKIENG